MRSHVLSAPENEDDDDGDDDGDDDHAWRATEDAMQNTSTTIRLKPTSGTVRQIG